MHVCRLVCAASIHNFQKRLEYHLHLAELIIDFAHRPGWADPITFVSKTVTFVLETSVIAEYRARFFAVDGENYRRFSNHHRTNWRLPKLDNSQRVILRKRKSDSVTGLRIVLCLKESLNFALVISARRRLTGAYFDRDQNFCLLRKAVCHLWRRVQ